MSRHTTLIVVITALLAVGGCVEVTLAPGAEKIRVTRTSADVLGCSAVGNVDGVTGTPNPGHDGNLRHQLQNRAFGLGANVVLLTTPFETEGVAYSCR